MSTERIRVIIGTGVAVRGDNIDTDRIIPARYLRSVSFEGLEQHLFADDRAQLDAQGPGLHPFSDPRYAGASILLVNANFGCGSSREHAPQAIRRRGIRAVIGQSFSEIFFGNAVALGLPCASAGASSVEALMRTVEQNREASIELDLERLIAVAGGNPFDISLPAAARESFLKGTWDATGLLLERYEEVEAVAARLPYTRWSTGTGPLGGRKYGPQQGTVGRAEDGLLGPDHL
jgi:3-isopropylmalate/(R)-2-methylmalate dehydratase small subunit